MYKPYADVEITQTSDQIYSVQIGNSFRTEHQATTCAESNIVYFNAAGSTVKLAGGTRAAEILMIEGNLEAQVHSTGTVS